MRLTIPVEVNVCRCGCGAEIPDGNDFVSSHDTKLQARLLHESGWTTLRPDQTPAMFELFKIWGESGGPAAYGLGQDIPGLTLGEEGVTAFLQERVRSRMADVNVYE